MMTIPAFLLAIAILVVIHEFGHYWVARRCGVKVLRFSVGFGKVLYSKRFANSDTEWVVSAIPLGGYVKMLDEREGEVAEADRPYAFNCQSVWKRIAIVAAGPIANLLLAVLLYWLMFVYGVLAIKPIIGEIPVNTPAASAGLQTGDTIVEVNGRDIPSWQEFGWVVLDVAMSGEMLEITSRDVNGNLSHHTLDSSKLDANELGGEFLSKLGLQLKLPKVKPVIGQLLPEGAAANGGLLTGDEVIEVNGVLVADWVVVVDLIQKSSGKPLVFKIRRDNALVDLTITPEMKDQNGVQVAKIGAGVQYDETAFKELYTSVSYNPIEATVIALRKTWEVSNVTLRMIGKMILGEVSVKNISGPITIADFAGKSMQSGIASYIGFLALISISIGIFNLLPVPLLDGGHLLYYAAEVIKGSPVSEQAWIVGQKIGIALLGVLMVFAIFNDIARLV